MFEAFGYSFMQRALFAGVLVGSLCAVIGVYVVLKGLSFIGTGISHASLGGIAIGIAVGTNPLWTGFGFSLLVAWGIAAISQKGNVKVDTAIGIFFSAAMAMGILVISLTPGYQADLMSYLFGSIAAVSANDVYVTLAVAAIVIGCVAYFYKDLMFVSFDSEMAQALGVPSAVIYTLLISLMALTVVVSIKVVGIVLASALIVTPAAAAYQLTEDFRKMMALSVVFGVGSCFFGIIAADQIGIPPGPTIVILSTLSFFACALFSPRRRRNLKSS